MTVAEALILSGPEPKSTTTVGTRELNGRQSSIEVQGRDSQSPAQQEHSTQSPPVDGGRPVDPEAERRKGEKGSDEYLMVAASNGDKAAFVVLYLRYRKRILKFCKRLLGNDAEAEEAAQDVFVKVYATRDRYQPTSRFAVFLYRIALNHCLNIKARKGRKITSSGHDMERQVGPSKLSPRVLAERNRLREALREAIRTIPARQAAALTLCHVYDLSSTEAGEMLESSGRAIKSLVHRARRQLKTTQRDALVGVKGWGVTEDT